MVSTVLIFAVTLLAQLVPEDAYRAEIEHWQARRESSLKSDDGWLTVAGLFWLKTALIRWERIRRTTSSCPPDRRPRGLAYSTCTTASSRFRPATAATLKPDSSDSPDMLRLNDLTMFVIERGQRYGIRLKDKNSELRKKFTGLKYFPVSEEYRERAKFVPYDPPKTIAVPNILGEIEQTPSPGYVEFTLKGRRLRLDPVTEGDTLFFIFKDLTSGKETYPPGRFLNTEMPKNGEVILDFNKAYNPPCAFTPYATCPLPPEQNKLPVAIEAGELRYGH